MKRTIGYSRISLAGEKSLSLKYQEAAIREYCERQQLTMIGIERDEVSGKDISNRDGFKRVLELINTGSVDCLVVYKSDRLSRNGIQTLELEALFAAKGVEYHSVVEGRIGSDNLESEFLSYIRAALNMRERRLIGLRTREAMGYKRKRGELIGRPPYGFKAVDGKLVADPQEQEIIARIHILHEKGYSVQGIIHELKSDGVKTRSGKDFSRMHVYRILRAA